VNTSAMTSTTRPALWRNSRNGLLAASTSGGTTSLWTPGAAKPVRVLRHGQPVFNAAFSPDGRRLAVGSGDGAAQLWNPSTGRRPDHHRRRSSQRRGVQS
jgi:WD40 repeat protein